MDDFVHKKRFGAIWSLNTRLEDFGLTDGKGYGTKARTMLHRVRTDLDALSEGEIACLENHGYSLADAALRASTGIVPKPDCAVPLAAYGMVRGQQIASCLVGEQSEEDQEGRFAIFDKKNAALCCATPAGQLTIFLQRFRFRLRRQFI